MSPALPAGAAISPAGPGLASLWRQRSGEIGDTPAVPPRNPPDSECELTGVGGRSPAYRVPSSPAGRAVGEREESPRCDKTASLPLPPGPQG